MRMSIALIVLASFVGLTNGQGVSCGNHQAPSCEKCPQGHGAAWCNGDCFWCNGKCQRERECKAISCDVPSASCELDLMFILDSSGSMRLRNIFQKEKNFLKLIAKDTYQFGANHRLAVINFAHDADLSISFQEYADNPLDFNALVDAIPLKETTTRLDLALRLAQRELDNKANGARDSAHKVVVVFTDGAQTHAPGFEDPGHVAHALRAEGASIVVIGIGPYTSSIELDCMAGGVGAAFKPASFAELDEILEGDVVKDIARKACKCVASK